MTTIAVSPDGQWVASGGWKERGIQIWNVPAKRKLATLQGHVQQVTVVTFHPDGQLIASASWDSVLRLWDVATGRPLMQLPLNAILQFSRDGAVIDIAIRNFLHPHTAC